VRGGEGVIAALAGRGALRQREVGAAASSDGAETAAKAAAEALNKFQVGVVAPTKVVTEIERVPLVDEQTGAKEQAPIFIRRGNVGGVWAIERGRHREAVAGGWGIFRGEGEGEPLGNQWAARGGRGWLLIPRGV